MLKKSHLNIMLFASVAAILPQQAKAQSTEADSEEIVVTARKISESLQEAPLAISAFSEETLNQRGIENLTDVARSTPGFAFENFNGAFATPTIRGQSQTRLTNPVQNVATFYNGVYLQRGYMIDPAMVNIGQVAILKGPQSAAFGRNAYAGAINFQSKEPGNEFHAMAMAAVGEDDYRRYDVSVEGPVIKDILSLIAGASFGEYDGGWRNNHPLANNAEALTKGKLGGYEYSTYHIGAKFTPSEDVTIKFNYIGNDRDVENPAQYSAGTASFDSWPNSNTNNCSSATLGTVPSATFLGLFCGTIPVQPVIGVGENRPAGLIVDPRSGVKLESEVISASAEFKLSDNLSLDYLFGKAEADFNGAGSAARNPILGLSSFPFTGRNLIDTTGNGSITSSSNELRLTYKGDNGFTAYVGGFLGETTDRTKFALVNVPAQSTGVLDPGVLLAGPGNAANSTTDYDISSAFGFAEYKNDSFAVSVEGRYTREKITETNLVAPVTSATRTFKYFTPRVTATAFLSDDSRIYVSYARGVKAGGFNTGGSNLAAFFDPTQATYGTESNNTFEIGSRNEFLDGKLILNATAYLIRASNVQVNRTRTFAPGVTTFSSVIGNLGSTRTLGFELEATYNMTDDFNVFAGLGYNNAEYGKGVIDTNIAVGKLCDNVVCNANGDIGGNRLERNPRLNVNSGFGYDTEVGEDFSVFVNGLVSYQGSQFINNINVTKVPSRVIADASIGARYKFIEFKLSADNLFDEKYVSSAFALTGGSSPFFYQRFYAANLGDRRRIVGSVTVKF